MKIHKVSYIENGYFEVKYNIGTVVQDLDAIKMTCPLDKSIKDIIMFLRTLKLERLQNEDDYDELKYRNHVILDISDELNKRKDMLDAMSMYAKLH